MDIGRKGAVHDEVNIIHDTELNKLQRCCYTYFGADNMQKHISVIIETLTVLSDRLELCEINVMLTIII